MSAQKQNLKGKNKKDSFNNKEGSQLNLVKKHVCKKCIEEAED